MSDQRKGVLLACVGAIGVLLFVLVLFASLGRVIPAHP